MLNRGGSSPRLVSTPAEEFVPKDASLLETETLALEVVPYGEAVGGIVDGCDVDDCGTVDG